MQLILKNGDFLMAAAVHIPSHGGQLYPLEIVTKTGYHQAPIPSTALEAS